MTNENSFHNSLNDDQLGFFFAHQYDENLDELLMDQLNALQYRLYQDYKQNMALHANDNDNELQLKSIPLDSNVSTTPLTHSPNSAKYDTPPIEPLTGFDAIDTSEYHFDDDLLETLKKNKDFVWLDIKRKTQNDSEMEKFDRWRENAMEDHFMSSLTSLQRRDFAALAGDEQEKEFIANLNSVQKSVFEQWKNKPVTLIPPFLNDLQMSENQKRIVLKLVVKNDFVALDRFMEKYPNFTEMYGWWKTARMNECGNLCLTMEHNVCSRDGEVDRRDLNLRLTAGPVKFEKSHLESTISRLWSSRTDHLQELENLKQQVKENKGLPLPKPLQCEAVAIEKRQPDESSEVGKTICRISPLVNILSFTSLASFSEVLAAQQVGESVLHRLKMMEPPTEDITLVKCGESNSTDQIVNHPMTNCFEQSFRCVSQLANSMEAGKAQISNFKGFQHKINLPPRPSLHSDNNELERIPVDPHYEQNENLASQQKQITDVSFRSDAAEHNTLAYTRAARKLKDGSTSWSLMTPETVMMDSAIDSSFFATAEHSFEKEEFPSHLVTSVAFVDSAIVKKD